MRTQLSRSAIFSISSAKHRSLIPYIVFFIDLREFDAVIKAAKSMWLFRHLLPYFLKISTSFPLPLVSCVCLAPPYLVWLMAWPQSAPAYIHYFFLFVPTGKNITVQRLHKSPITSCQLLNWYKFFIYPSCKTPRMVGTHKKD